MGKDKEGKEKKDKKDKKEKKDKDKDGDSDDGDDGMGDYFGTQSENRGFLDVSPDEGARLAAAAAAKKKRREEQFRQLFRQMSGADRHLDPQEMKRLAMKIASMNRIDPACFGEVELMFWRYDFSGDGKLDENEGLMLIEGMCRAVKDARDPRAARAGMRSTRDIPNKRMEQYYQISKKLGQGGQGAVYLAVDRSNGQEKVVKYYDKSCANAPADDIIDEFALLTKLDHPKIARTYEIFQDTANFYVVSEPYFGGDLSTAVEKAQKAGVGLTEKWFADIWRQSMEGVAFLHTQHTMHCDIKEPNIMISSKDNWQNPNVVVIDFGLAQGFGAGSMPGGTPGYMPPEVWQCGLWTPKGDTFAMGVTFYSMITMQGSPFVRGATSIDHVKMITMQCRLPPPSGHLASPQGRALNMMITRMLSRDFHSRPTMAQVLQDPWMRQASGGAMEIDRSAIRRMTQVHDMSLLQKGLLADMASRENLAQLEELSATFTSMDSDNDGMVSKDEARTALRKSGLGSAEIEQLIETLIGDQGSVSYTVFMGQLIAAKKGDSVNTLRQVFQQYDADSNGYLDQREIREMLSQPAILDAFPKGKTAEAILKEYGWDKMRKVTWEDFRHAFENEVSPENTNSQYKKGDSVEYYSPSYGKWVQCVVTETRDDGAIQVNVKPGFWFAMRDQGSKIRKSGAGTAASPGQALLAAALGF